MPQSLRAIAYVSTASRGLTPHEIDSILHDAREFNAENDVSGVLLFSGDTFFQYLEGGPKELDLVMARIRFAASHEEIQILSDESITQRAFSEWNMGFTSTPKSDIQHMANADWAVNMPTERTAAQLSEGLRLVSLYWSKWVAGMR